MSFFMKMITSNKISSTVNDAVFRRLTCALKMLYSFSAPSPALCFIKLNYNHAQKMTFLPGRTFQGQTVLDR